MIFLFLIFWEVFKIIIILMIIIIIIIIINKYIPIFVVVYIGIIGSTTI
jgi:hypothetical protein